MAAKKRKGVRASNDNDGAWRVSTAGTTIGAKGSKFGIGMKSGSTYSSPGLEFRPRIDNPGANKNVRRKTRKK